jgi:hypothetical protein
VPNRPSQGKEGVDTDDKTNKEADAAEVEDVGNKGTDDKGMDDKGADNKLEDSESKDSAAACVVKEDKVVVAVVDNQVAGLQ